MRHPADCGTDSIAHSPDQAKPRRAVVEAVIEIDEKRCTGLELGNAGTHSGLRVGNVVQHAEAVSEITARILKRNVVGTGLGEFDIFGTGEIAFCDGKRVLARIE